MSLARQHAQRRTFTFGLTGLAFTLWFWLRDSGHWPGPLGNAAVWLTLATGVAVAFLLRATRRKLVFGPAVSWHKAFSFDAIFQGAILVHPQLPYPDVEREFLAHHTHRAPEDISSWFDIRRTSAVAIPTLLLAAAANAAGHVPAAAILAAAGALWILVRALRTVPNRLSPFAHFAGTVAGALGAIVEGTAFARAAIVADPNVAEGNAVLLYAALLIAYELSPVPLALGVLEAVFVLAAFLAPQVPLPPLALALVYRVARAFPAVLLMEFYLPRYKMRGADLFDPGLPAELAKLRQPQGHDDDSAGPLLSVILPAYNEEKRLPVYLPDVLAFCDSLHAETEIIVVDDGSRDGTAAYVTGIATRHPNLRLVSQGVNQGKGAAVKRGVSEARGRFVLFADSDGATPIAEASKLLRAAESGADVVIGSRKAASGDVRRDRSFFREFLGSMFYRITNLLAVPGVEDTQCGFKLFRRAAARRVFPALTEKGWAFDVQVLFLAQKLGMLIVEVPVNWSAVEGSKLKPSDAAKMFWALLRVRRRSAGIMGSR